MITSSAKAWLTDFSNSGFILTYLLLSTVMGTLGNLNALIIFTFFGLVMKLPYLRNFILTIIVHFVGHGWLW